MAHESFEDERIAALLNRDFVAIKVDREERPDVDRIYMLFVQATTGSGGWPMSVFLTPQLKPFFGGTYFPPGTRYGRPGFAELLTYLAGIWQKERAKVEDSSASVTEQLRQMSASAQAGLADPADVRFPVWRLWLSTQISASGAFELPAALLQVRSRRRSVGYGIRYTLGDAGRWHA